MNEKCKYCDYVSKCSRKCEYDSIICKVLRSFPKVVDKSYEQLRQENKQLKDLIDSILSLPFFKDMCPLDLSFENNSREDKAQIVFYDNEWCENNCSDNYKNCWLKYFKKLQEQGSDSNEKNN